VRDILYSVLPPILAFMVRLMMGCVRVKEVWGKEEATRAILEAGGRAIYATWHQRMSYHFYHLSRLGIRVLISPSRDGELAARLAMRLGFGVIRGSSSREGFQGLMGAVHELKNGRPVGMLVDGPLGPPRVAKIGTILMAWLGQAPIIPVLWGVDKGWVMNSWDRYLIPKPFSNAVIKYEKPIWIPRETERDSLEYYRKILEDTLNQGTDFCDRYFGKIRPKSKDE